MFNRPTVFVLGAGASWDYGYPTGLSLVTQIIQMARDFSKFCEESIGVDRQRAPNDQVPDFVLETQHPHGHAQMWIQTQASAMELARKLYWENPVLIDHYIGRHPQLARLAKLLIALVILNAEWKHSTEAATNFKMGALRSEDWYRFLYDKIARGCRDTEHFCQCNQVKFVTFNYDVSLEYQLYSRLSATPAFISPDLIQNFLNDNIVHIYGRVRDNFMEELGDFDTMLLTHHHNDPNTRSQIRHRAKVMLDAAYRASQKLKVIAPLEKEADEEDLRKAKEAISRAEDVYILGYGFDQMNNDLLSLSDSLGHVSNSHSPKTLMVTNFDSQPRIQSRVGRVVGEANRKIMRDAGALVKLEVQVHAANATVFDSFAKHFDMDR